MISVVRWYDSNVQAYALLETLRLRQDMPSFDAFPGMCVYIYIYICVCVCACACVFFILCACARACRLLVLFSAFAKQLTESPV